MKSSEGKHRDLQDHQRLRSRRNRRRALIRSIHLLPSTATLGNAICGFAAIYIASLSGGAERDPWTQYFSDSERRFVIPAYLIFIAMLFDALDGRLARFTRHTTDFGGQLDSMADVISFGVAPAILMLQACRALPEILYENVGFVMPHALTRAIWGMGAVYASCAAIRLARFNVSNQHGEQHHFSFLGLPSPAAGGTVAAIVLMAMAISTQMDELRGTDGGMLETLRWCYVAAMCILPLATLAVGLLMVSMIRYPHVINRWLRGQKSVGRLVGIVLCAGLVIALHKYAVAIAMLIYTAWGLVSWGHGRWRHSGQGTGATK